MFSSPEKNIEQLHLADGGIVADFGAGSGAYTVAAAKAMHGTGKVYAIDVQKGILTRLERSCREERLGNVSFIWGDLEKLGGTKLADGSCDVVILSNILFQVPDKKAAMGEAKRVLRLGGILLVIDWMESFNNMGPTKERVFPEADGRKLAEELGFLFDRPINAGNYHYGLVLRKVSPRAHA
ncbi:MAG: class I SAM-dependent methyltransferase [Patescibacteria group bacterium]